MMASRDNLFVLNLFPIEMDKNSEIVANRIFNCNRSQALTEFTVDA